MTTNKIKMALLFGGLMTIVACGCSSTPEEEPTPSPAVPTQGTSASQGTVSDSELSSVTKPASQDSTDPAAGVTIPGQPPK